MHADDMTHKITTHTYSGGGAGEDGAGRRGRRRHQDRQQQGARRPCGRRRWQEGQARAGVQGATVVWVWAAGRVIETERKCRGGDTGPIGPARRTGCPQTSPPLTPTHPPTPMLYANKQSPLALAEPTKEMLVPGIMVVGASVLSWVRACQPACLPGSPTSHHIHTHARRESRVVPHPTLDACLPACTCLIGPTDRPTDKPTDPF